jgi:hypothetical protein
MESPKCTDNLWILLGNLFTRKTILFLDSALTVICRVSQKKIIFSRTLDFSVIPIFVSFFSIRNENFSVGIDGCWQFASSRPCYCG